MHISTVYCGAAYWDAFAKIEMLHCRVEMNADR